MIYIKVNEYIDVAKDTVGYSFKHNLCSTSRLNIGDKIWCRKCDREGKNYSKYGLGREIDECEIISFKYNKKGLFIQVKPLYEGFDCCNHLRVARRSEYKWFNMKLLGEKFFLSDDDLKDKLKSDYFEDKWEYTKKRGY